MYQQQMELSYRRSAVAGATSIGLVIALYDTLTGNLRRAAVALRNDNIEARCAELNHGLLVLGQLESMIDKQSKDDLASSLSLFYGYLRSKMLIASLEKSASMLEEQIELVLQVRTAWQQRDVASSQTVPTELLANQGSAHAERTSFSLSM